MRKVLIAVVAAMALHLGSSAVFAQWGYRVYPAYPTYYYAPASYVVPTTTYYASEPRVTYYYHTPTSYYTSYTPWGAYYAPTYYYSPACCNYWCSY